MSNSYFISILLHLGLFIATLMVTPPLLEKLDDKQITVELIEPVEAMPPQQQVAAPKSDNLDPQAAPEQQQAVPAQASAPERAEEADAIKAPMKKAQVARAVKAKSPITKLKAASRADKVVHAKTPSRAGVAIPETLDDIESSDLDYDSVAMTQAGDLNESEFDNEFSKVDQKSEAALKAQKSAFDSDLRNAQESSEKELAGIENENKENAKAMSDSLNATRTKNAAMLAKIRAGEIAAENERLAREGALKAARDAAAARAAAAKASSKVGGNGNNTFGVASGKVRSIENLRQMPGNPKPSYSMDERFQKQQGTVVFQAYVTEQGALQQFKLLQSTGYRNLDGKTLAALKKWRFYPGQQGWVEIPQTWNLKGEAEEMPAALRRKVSQR